MAGERTPRMLESRDQETRPTSWKPPSVLPDPAPQDGWVFRWIRIATLGISDNPNVSMRFREGWEPVKAEDHPELALSADATAEWTKRGGIEVGGLLLCKMPAEVAKQRQDYYEKMANQQMESVDNTFMRENDPRMPLLKPERKTMVSFGGSVRTKK